VAGARFRGFLATSEQVTVTLAPQMRLAESPTFTGVQRLNSVTPRLWRGAREVHRRVFCYSLALAKERSEQGGPPTLAVRAVNTIPFGQVLRQRVRHRPGPRRIPVSRLLMGSHAGLDSSGFANAFGTLRFGSMPMDQSPHVELLRLAYRSDRRLSDEEIKTTAYFQFARHLADTWGNYFGAESDDEIIGITRNFVSWSQGMEKRMTGNSGSPTNERVLVAKVQGSSTYQVLDGHHRLAVAIARGDRSVKVHRTWLSTETALQWRLFERGLGSRRARALDQPVAARELSDWTVAQNCADRLVRIQRLVDRDPGDTATRPSFLDVGCGYGWYLGELKRLGWRVRGVDRDRLASEIATAFYDLGEDEIVVGEWAPAVESLHETFDVVACLRLGAALRTCDSDGAAMRMLRALDQRTGRALVVDARCSSGAGAVTSSAEGLTALVLRSTSFSKVEELGMVTDPSVTGHRASSSVLLAYSR
jgi:SAM-dependent methyltransferase